MKTTPALRSRPLRPRLFAQVRAALAVTSFAALAFPVQLSAQTPTFSAMAVTSANTGSVFPESAAVGDFNGDGKLDSIITGAGNELRVLLGDGLGTFATRHVGPPQITPGNVVNLPSNLTGFLPVSVGGFGAIQAVDVNSDGKLDVVCVESAGINFFNYSFIGVLLNTGNDGTGLPQFTAIHHYAGSAVRPLTVGDLNGDGRIDFIYGTAFGGHQVWLSNGNGTFASGQVFNITPGNGSPSAGQGVIADLTGDGHADFITTSNQNGGANVFRGNGDGTFQTPAMFLPNSAVSVAVADVNGDNRPDLLMGNLAANSQGLFVYLNNGGGIFGAPALIPITGLNGAFHGGGSVALADVNGDGNLDAALSLFYNGVNNVFFTNIVVLLGDGSGGFGARSDFTANSVPTYVFARDFNNDGKTDIGTILRNTRSFGVLKNTTPIVPPVAPPIIFSRSSATAEAWKKYTVNFSPTQTGTYTLNFNLTAGGPSGDNSILIDAVKITQGATTVFSDGFETPDFPTNGGASANGGSAVIGNWQFNNYSGILDGSPPNWGLDGQGLGSADGTTQYAYLQAVFGTLGRSQASGTLALTAGQTYTLSFYQASRRDFGGTTTYNVSLDLVPSDTTPPVIAAPADIVREATGPGGAVVTFSASANDNVDGPVAVVASPASGSMFPIATTAVGLAASDAAGNTATASFTVTVLDTVAPVVSVPGNITAEATGPGGAAVAYPAPTATDAVGVTSLASAPASGSAFALGTTTVTATARDAAGNTGSGSFTVAVVDTTAPVLTVPASQTLEATGPAGATAAFSASATDAVGVAGITYSSASGSTFAIGITTVNVTATDAAGNTSSGSFTITVRDTTAPVIASVIPSSATLWSPNHRMVAISIAAVATDTVGVTSLKIIGVTSNEPDNGLGDGDTAGDIQITGNLAVNLRAERSGKGNGRIYTITVEARDAAGNTTTRTCTVSVPKSQGKK